MVSPCDELGRSPSMAASEQSVFHLMVSMLIVPMAKAETELPFVTQPQKSHSGTSVALSWFRK